MNKYSCIIIDDEWHAIELLKLLVNMLNSNLEIINTYTSWSKAVEGLRSIECDILFLDISIEGKNGMDLLKLVPDLQSEVIFTTAYSDYAINAIKLSPCGYLLKPIDEIELGITIDKAISRLQQKRLAKQQAAPVVEKVGIYNNKGIDYVDVKDIIYFESINQYTKVVTLETEFISSYHLGKFNNITDNYPFYKVHRSYVINLNYILRYETTGIVILSNKKEIPVSRNLRNDFLKIFDAAH